jgi:hypothetical protein
MKLYNKLIFKVLQVLPFGEDLGGAFFGEDLGGAFFGEDLDGAT